MTVSNCLWTMEHPDGLARIDMYCRKDGIFFFVWHGWRNDGYGDHTPEWTSGQSGLYQSEDAAFSDAAAEFDWLKSMKSN